MTPILSQKPAKSLSVATNTYQLSNFEYGLHLPNNLKFDEKIETLFNQNRDLTKCDSELVDKNVSFYKKFHFVIGVITDKNVFFLIFSIRY